MTTHKRINGDYRITTINTSDSVTLDTDIVSVTGNLDISGNTNATGNYYSPGNMFVGSVSANVVSANFLFGDGQYLSNVVANVGGASILQNGLTNVDVPVANGAVQVQINGTPNVVVIDSSGITASDITTTNLIVNSIRSDDSSVVNIDDGVRIQNNAEVFGNVSANYFLGNGALLTGVITSVSSISDGTTNMSVVSSGGNIVGNIAGSTILVLSSAGANVTGNVTADYFLGNGSQLSGIDATSIQSGTSNVKVVSSGGNVTTSVGGTSNVMVVSSTGAAIIGDLSVTGNATLSGNILGDRVVNGTSSFEIQTPSGNANISIGGTSNVAVFTTAGADITGVLNASGNVNGANLNVTGNLVDSAALEIITGSNGNITLSPDGSGVIVANKDIRNGQANGVGNIGSSTTYFNTIFAQATSAQYADLAEIYLADKQYEPGTVLRFGGEYEVTECNDYHDHRVAGVVSTNPAHLMNAGHQGAFPVKLALVGRVPCRVRGPVLAGDILVSAGQGWAQVNNQAQAGRIIGKSLENSTQDATIEIVVGKH